MYTRLIELNIVEQYRNRPNELDFSYNTILAIHNGVVEKLLDIT